MPLHKPVTLRDLLFLVPLSLFFLLYGLGRGSLASWDEALYAAVAKDMALSGDWLHLTLGGSPWIDKPPLSIWATALFYRWFGISEFSARLFSALCGAGAVITTYFIGRQLLNRWSGLLGALVLISSSHFIRFARFGMMDAPLTFFLTLALYFFWMGRHRNRYLIFFGIVMGLAVMTKGFAAFLVFPVIGVYAVLTRETEIFGRSSLWIGLMIAAAIALPWHLYSLMADQHGFMKDLVVKHLFTRTTSALDGHAGNFYFYIRTLINKYHPWVIIGIFSAPYFLYRAIRHRESETVFLASWMFVLLAIVTLVRTKLPWYILPVYPALSLTIGHALGSVLSERRGLLVKAGFLFLMILHIPYSHILDHDYSRPIKALATKVQQVAPEGEPLYLYNYHESPAAYFYWGRGTVYLDTPQQFLERFSAGKPMVCLIRSSDLPAVESVPGAVESFHKEPFEEFILLSPKISS